MPHSLTTLAELFAAEHHTAQALHLRPHRRRPRVVGRLVKGAAQRVLARFGRRLPRR